MELILKHLLTFLLQVSTRTGDIDAHGYIYTDSSTLLSAPSTTLGAGHGLVILSHAPWPYF